MPYNFKNGSWVQGCGCQGKPVTAAVIPPGSVPFLFKATLPQVYTGETGIIYVTKPFVVSLDVTQADAAIFEARGLGNILPENRYLAYIGDLTRQGQTP